MRNGDLSLSLSFRICSKCSPILLDLATLTDLAAHIVIGPSDGMAVSSGIEQVIESASELRLGEGVSETPSMLQLNQGLTRPGMVIHETQALLNGRRFMTVCRQGRQARMHAGSGCRTENVPKHGDCG